MLRVVQILPTSGRGFNTIHNRDLGLGYGSGTVIPRRIEGKRSSNGTLLRSCTLIHHLDGSGRMVDDSEGSLSSASYVSAEKRSNVSNSLLVETREPYLAPF